MKKRWMIAALLIVMVCSLAACRKQPAQLPLEETTLPAEAEQQAETQQTEAKEEAPGFAGGILEDDPAAEDTKPEPTSETVPIPTETEPEATTSGGGIPYHSGEEDLLEPPANSSAGEL